MEVLTGEKGAFSIMDYFMHHQVFCNKSVEWTARLLLDRNWLQVRLKWWCIIITDNVSAIIALLFTLLRHLVTRGQGCCWRSARHGEDSRVTNNSKEEGRGRPRERKELFTDRRACICCLDVKNLMKKRRAFIGKYAGVTVCSFTGDFEMLPLWVPLQSNCLVCSHYLQRPHIRKENFGLMSRPVVIMEGEMNLSDDVNI